jgi:hypothetical protein
MPDAKRKKWTIRRYTGPQRAEARYARFTGTEDEAATLLGSHHYYLGWPDAKLLHGWHYEGQRETANRAGAAALAVAFFSAGALTWQPADAGDANRIAAAGCAHVAAAQISDRGLGVAWDANQSDLSGACFVIDEELARYIASVNPKVDAYAVADEFQRAGEMYQLDPWLLASIARYESTFNTKARGRAGERGLLQVHPIHNCSGLGYTCCGARILRRRLDEGQDLYTALRPWAVRKRALREYERLNQLRIQTSKESNDG